MNNTIPYLAVQTPCFNGILSFPDPSFVARPPFVIRNIFQKWPSSFQWLVSGHRVCMFDNIEDVLK